MPDQSRRLAALAGVLTGMAAGFLGVGGGEFRIPVLVQVLALPLKDAGGINLVVGLFTVALSVSRRWGHQAIPREDLFLLYAMGTASVIGAGVGVMFRERLPHRPLKIVVCTYLLVMGVWMLYESLSHSEHILLEPSGLIRVELGAVIALAIAVVSGVLGVAGGEMRVPALLYLFAIPIQAAGTLSLMVSIPTLAAGALTDRRLGGLPNTALRVGVLMGIASAFGVALGAALLPYANRDLIKGALGVALLLATVRMAIGRAHEISNEPTTLCQPFAK